MTGTEKFLPSPSDTWMWTLATADDVQDITDMAQGFYEDEISEFLVPDIHIMKHHVHKAVVNQQYQLSSEQIIVARNKVSNQLMAWAWLVRGNYAVYSATEAAEARFAHVALDLPTSTRVKLLAQTIQQWILWCHIHAIPVLISSSIREQQKGFMKLHERFGFLIRGSIAYKNVTKDLT